MDLTDCDLEPIHIPGAIQPFGLMLIVARDTGEVIGGAGSIERSVRADWLHRPLQQLIGAAMADKVLSCPDDRCELGHLREMGMDAVAFLSGEHWLVQLEPSSEATPALQVLGWTDQASRFLEKAPDLGQLCERAARSFSELTGYDRVMIYRFVDDDAGEVIAEWNITGMPGFRNHRFPGSDIPKQARALYVRNKVRVIPDVHYEPQVIRPGTLQNIDLSDVETRSVSPVHIQYLKNMGVSASASMSIVCNGNLWGLVACHNNTPRGLNMTQRRAAQLLAADFSRQIAAMADAEHYRQSIHLRAEEDGLLACFADEGDFFKGLSTCAGMIRRMFAADGLAIIDGERLHSEGVCPSGEDLRELAEWARLKSATPYHTSELGRVFAPATGYSSLACGLLSVTLSMQSRTSLIWFRAEELQTVEWAGNPHGGKASFAGEVLTPRSSFEAWSEIVRGRSRPWSVAETEAAHRLVAKLYDIRQHLRLIETATELRSVVADRDRLLENAAGLPPRPDAEKG